MSSPWAKILPFAPGEPGEDVDRIVYQATECLRISGILLQPWMPSKANFLLDQLGVRPDRRTFEWCKPGMDLEYGESMVPLGIGKAEGVLFPRLPSHE
jgi:methionyl-tRNA synthetase